MPLAAENRDLPAFRRDTYLSVYGEGWALYSETLGEEMGMYETPYELFGMLSYQAWRASRLVVVTGLHAKGRSEERCVGKSVSVSVGLGGRRLIKKKIHKMKP